MEIKHIDHVGLVAAVCDEAGIVDLINEYVGKDGRKVSVGRARPSMRSMLPESPRELARTTLPIWIEVLSGNTSDRNSFAETIRQFQKQLDPQDMSTMVMDCRRVSHIASLAVRYAPQITEADYGAFDSDDPELADLLPGAENLRQAVKDAGIHVRDQKRKPSNIIYSHRYAGKHGCQTGHRQNGSSCSEKQGETNRSAHGTMHTHFFFR